jgi:hypothetical protein
MGSSGCDLWFHHLSVRLQSNIDWDRGIGKLAGERSPLWKNYDVGTVTCRFQMIVSQSIVDLGCTERLWVTDHTQWQHYKALRPLTLLIRGVCWCCNPKCCIFDQHQNAQMTTLRENREHIDYGAAGTAGSKDIVNWVYQDTVLGGIGVGWTQQGSMCPTCTSYQPSCKHDCARSVL